MHPYTHLLSKAYEALLRSDDWGRDYEPDSQLLLCQLRDTIAQEQGRDVEEVQNEHEARAEAWSRRNAILENDE